MTAPLHNGAFDALAAALHRRSRVQLATGVLMEELACPPGTAQVWLRCLARARGQSVLQVAVCMLRDRTPATAGPGDDGSPDSACPPA